MYYGERNRNRGRRQQQQQQKGSGSSSSAANAYLAAMNEYKNTMCSEKDDYARAMLK